MAGKGKEILGTLDVTCARILRKSGLIPRESYHIETVESFEDQRTQGELLAENPVSDCEGEENLRSFFNRLKEHCRKIDGSL